MSIELGRLAALNELGASSLRGKRKWLTYSEALGFILFSDFNSRKSCSHVLDSSSGGASPAHVRSHSGFSNEYVQIAESNSSARFC